MTNVVDRADTRPGIRFQCTNCGKEKVSSSGPGLKWLLVADGTDKNGTARYESVLHHACTDCGIEIDKANEPIEKQFDDIAKANIEASGVKKVWEEHRQGGRSKEKSSNNASTEMITGMQAQQTAAMEIFSNLALMMQKNTELLMKMSDKLDERTNKDKPTSTKKPASKRKTSSTSRKTK